MGTHSRVLGLGLSVPYLERELPCVGISVSDMEELRFCIADLAVSLQANSIEQVDALRLPFVTSRAPEVIVRFHVHSSPYPIMGSDLTMKGADSGWLIYPYGQKQIAVHRQPYMTNEDTESHLVVSYDTTTNEFDVYNPSSRGKEISSRFLRSPLASALPSKQGLMIHACGVSMLDNGLLFSGRSGVGKSTMGALWHEVGQATVLHDDCCIVRKIKGDERLFGVPWLSKGGFCSAEDVPLKAIFFLKHGKSNDFSLLEHRQALDCLLSQVFFPTWGEVRTSSHILEHCVDLVQKIPCYLLSFIPERDVVDSIRSVLRI